ncbi:MAG: hypothetical protein ACJAZS_000715 [Alteromonas naphthalenivorans]|jgi:hypothetical protein
MKKRILVCLSICSFVLASESERATSAPPIIESIQTKNNGGFQSLVALAQAHARNTKVAPAPNPVPPLKRGKPPQMPVVLPVHRDISKTAGSIRLFIDTPPEKRKYSFSFTVGPEESDEEPKEQSNTQDKVKALGEKVLALNQETEGENNIEEEEGDEGEDLNKETSCAQTCATGVVGAGKFICRLVAAVLCL